MSFKRNTSTNNQDQIAMSIATKYDDVVKPKSLKQQLAEMKPIEPKIEDEMSGVRVGKYIPSVQLKMEKVENR